MLKNKSILWVVGLLLVVGGLLAWPMFSNTPEDNNNITGVRCLVNESFHIHPHLQILVNDTAEILPTGIGIEPGCIREIHTHAADGDIHIESAADRGYKFSDFLLVWKQPLDRSGYTLKMTVDGILSTDTSFVMKDKQQIIFNYTKIQ